jgi:predicted alpha/beta superfamily hydrolase
MRHISGELPELMRDMAETLRETFGRVFQNRRRSERFGRLEKHNLNDRTVSVYLPPGYNDREDRRYPVLYMQDGQNLFEPERAFAGNPWKIDAAAQQVINARKAEPMIIVGVDHAGEARIEEYTPTHDAKKKAGGGAQKYAEFLVNEVKPMIEATYRTNGKSFTGGSSLGGLVALYLALTRPDVFSGAAVMSPSIWWDNKSVLQFVDTFGGEQQPRLWVDIGGREGAEALDGARALRDRLQSRNWRDLHYEEDRRADHSERAWQRRIPRVLEFLFPPV